MKPETSWRRYVRFWGPDVAADVDDEMDAHLDLLTAELMRKGLSASAARLRALDEFGDRAAAKEACVKIGEERLTRKRRAEWYDSLYQDLRFAVRSLRKTPAFTIVAVLALALGIGANAAVFSIVDAAAFRPLPVKNPEKLVALYAVQGRNEDLQTFSYPAYQAIRADRQAFADVVAFSEGAVTLSDGGDATVAWSHIVTDNYFTMLGLSALHGRMIMPGDLRQPVVVIGETLWRNRFASDPRIIGRTLQLNGQPLTVVGIAPASFTGTRLFSYAPMLWLPAGMSDLLYRSDRRTLDNPETWPFHVVARLADGVTAAAAQPRLNAIAAQVSATYGKTYDDWHITYVSNRTAVNPWLAPPEKIRAIGRIVLFGVALVLLIACADVANLLLARMTVRRTEVAVRLSLGASRARIVRQLLTESVVLALLGAVAALPLTYLAVQASSALAPRLDFATAYRPVLDARVFVFNALIALAAGIVFGIAPAWRGAAAGLANVLREDSRSATGRRSGMRDGLVIVQIAISIVVLVSAGLFTRSLVRARSIDPGFKPDNALVVAVDPELSKAYDTARTERLYRELMQSLRAIPGVTSVGRSTWLPLTGSWGTTTVFAEGRATSIKDGLRASEQVVDEGYFATMGIPLLEGRSFQPSDKNAAIEPVVINRALADLLWPGEPALGKRIRQGSEMDQVSQVIGVTASTPLRKLGEEAEPLIAFDLSRNPRSHTEIVVRTSGDLALHYAPVRRAIRELDPALAVLGPKTLRESISVSYSAAESGAFGSAAFGFLALLLATSGIYGVISYGVAQRKREIGIRMALGARWGDVVHMVLGRGLRLASIGIVAGIVAALLVSRSLAGILYGVSPNDPLTFVSVALLLAAVSLAASFVPALRAARMEPTETLRA